MSKKISYNGKTYVVPDDATDDEITKIVNPDLAEMKEKQDLAEHEPGIPEVLKGMAQGVGTTVSGVSGLIHAIPWVGPKIVPQSGINALKSASTPETPGAQFGHGFEQAAEYAIPTGLEEKAITLLPKAAQASRFIPPLVRVGEQAVESGLHNKVQGGDFTTGAIAGGIAGLTGEGMRLAAPAIAESSIGIRGRDRLFGRTPGRAILDETTGIRPGAIQTQAENKLSLLDKELDAAAARSPQMATLQPARNAVDSAIAEAKTRNSPTALKRLNKIKTQLTTELDAAGNPIMVPTTATQTRNVGFSPTPQVSQVTTGATPQAIPVNVSPTKLRALKQGIGDEINSWMVEDPKMAESVKHTVYGNMDKELDRTVPESESLNDRMSSLIPVTRRAQAADMNAGMAQRALHRIAAHTGALTGAVTGGYAGYHEKGIPGAIGGATLGIVIPEALASPTGEMAVARMMNRPSIPVRLGTGTGIQLVRNLRDDEDEEASK